MNMKLASQKTKNTIRGASINDNSCGLIQCSIQDEGGEVDEEHLRMNTMGTRRTVDT